jgi:hypothetical protein
VPAYCTEYSIPDLLLVYVATNVVILPVRLTEVQNIDCPFLSLFLFLNHVLKIYIQYSV